MRNMAECFRGPVGLDTLALVAMKMPLPSKMSRTLPDADRYLAKHLAAVF